MPMGFTHDPGPLPFTTIRDRDKWGPRLTNGMIEIVGEHGCTMPLQMARVVEIRELPYGLCPPHLAHVYANRPLIAVRLDHLKSGEKRVG